MKRFINKILNEAKKINDDPFFKPKEIKKREDIALKERDEISYKIEKSLQRIKIAYANGIFTDFAHEMFLLFFSELNMFYKRGQYSSIYLRKYSSGIDIVLFSIEDKRVFLPIYLYEKMFSNIRLSSSNIDIARKYVQEYFRFILKEDWVIM